MLNELARYVFAVLVWPGVLGAGALGFLYLWIARKTAARLQGRRGPALLSAVLRFREVVGQRDCRPQGRERTAVLRPAAICRCSATAFGLVIVPSPGNSFGSFPGDIVLLLYLLEVPVLCDVLAGYVSQSIYGQVSAMREAVLSLAYNLPLLAAVIALAQYAHSFRLGDLQHAHFGVVTVLAMIAFLLAIPARLKSNPFSIPNAEQEIVAGAHVEYNSAPLAIFELSHALEVVLLFDVFFVLFAPAARQPAGERGAVSGGRPRPDRCWSRCWPRPPRVSR